jgi:hypothetical protein
LDGHVVAPRRPGNDSKVTDREAINLILKC